MFIRHRQAAQLSEKLPCMTSQTLASTLEGFLSGSNNAVVIEDGAVVFDLGAGEVFGLGREQQMPAAFVVAGTKCRAESVGCRD